MELNCDKRFTKEEATTLSREEKEEVLNDRAVGFAKTDSDDFLVNNILYSNKFV